MKPTFKKGGITTAGNASIIRNGATAVVVMATIDAQVSASIDMKYILVATIWAVPKCIKKKCINLDAVDLFEINEAFSGLTCAVINELKLDPTKANMTGGSVALGHPIGLSGCGILMTLIHKT